MCGESKSVKILSAIINPLIDVYRKLKIRYRIPNFNTCSSVVAIVRLLKVFSLSFPYTCFCSLKNRCLIWLWLILYMLVLSSPWHFNPTTRANSSIENLICLLAILNYISLCVDCRTSINNNLLLYSQLVHLQEVYKIGSSKQILLWFKHLVVSFWDNFLPEANIQASTKFVLRRDVVSTFL